jgi:Alginate lyase
MTVLFTRRDFCRAAIAGLAVPQVAIDVPAIEHERVVRAANRYLHERPVTITAQRSPRSAGGPHDFFSEGDYWWPDPEHPGGPYIQRDGLTNTQNFVAHRHALIRLSLQVPALTAAWHLTKKRAYAAHAVEHLRAWFLNPATLMNPNLQYAQAIHGRVTGRGIGVIDTIHLVEVARALPFLRDSLTPGEQDGLTKWFKDYLHWMTTSNNGIEEREAKNNHGTCWVMQVAQFARYVGDDALIKFCAERFKTVLVPNQIASDGRMPLELARTKPYSYCLFNLDALATICQILSSPEDDLWNHALADGRGLRKAMAFMAPYIADKRSWPLPPDVQHFDDFPVRQPSLLFAGLAYSEPRYLELWRRLNPDPTVDEVIRNYPIRQPTLWV